MIAYNEDLDSTPPQDILNVFAAANLSSRSSSDSTKYKRAWLKAKVIRSYIISTGVCPDAYSRSLSIALNHKKICPITVGDQHHFSKKTMPVQLPDMNKIKMIVLCNISW